MNPSVTLLLFPIQFIICSTVEKKFSITYYGDMTYQQYLNEIACNEQLPSLYRFIMIDFDLDEFFNQTLTKQDKRSTIDDFLIKNQCKYTHLHKVNLLKSIYDDDYNRYKKLQILFNLNIYKVGDIKLKFSMIMNILSNVYKWCSNCLPFQFYLSAELEPLLTNLSWTPNELKVVFIFDKSWEKLYPVTYFNPILNGCYQYSGIIKSTQSEMIKRMKISFQKCNLGQTTLTVAMRFYPALCELDQDSGSNETQLIGGVEINLLKFFAHKLNFKIRVNPNILMSNNSTESMISSILQDESQFGMCAIMYNKRRFREATMTNFVFSDGMGFISRNDKLINRDWLILKPFPTIIWIFILAVFIVIISVMNIADRYHPTDKNGKYNLWKFERTTRLIGIFLNQSVNTWKERGNSSRLKYGVWMFSTLILSTNYISIFYSLLTLPQYERPIDTVNDLMESIKDDSHTIWTQSNYEYLRRMFQRSPPQFKVLHEIGKHMTR